MGPRTRKAVAALGVLGFLTLYIWAAVELAGRVPDWWWAKALYFAVVGTAWGVPLLPLLTWAETGRFLRPKAERVSGGERPKEK